MNTISSNYNKTSNILIPAQKDKVFCGESSVSKTVPNKKITAKNINLEQTCGTISILGGVLLALGLKTGLQKISSILRNNMKKPARVIDMKLTKYNYSGPSFNINTGKTSISDAWNEYIDNVENRIKSHDNYKKIFSDNIETLDKYEEVANRRISERLNKVA